MSLRGWDRGIAVAALIATVGIAVAQTPPGNFRSLILIGITAICAAFAIFLLRPRSIEEEARRLAQLLRQTTARDIAFLRVASTTISWPKTHSLNTLPFAPLGEKWLEESDEQANIRAQKLISLDLMEPRGSETETSTLGLALVAFYDLQRIKR